MIYVDPDAMQQDLDAIATRSKSRNDLFSELLFQILPKWSQNVPEHKEEIIEDCASLLSGMDEISQCACAKRESNGDLCIERSWKVDILPKGRLSLRHGSLAPPQRQVIPLGEFHGQDENDSRIVTVNWLGFVADSDTSLIVVDQGGVSNVVPEVSATVSAYASTFIAFVDRERKRREMARRAAQFTTSSLVAAQFRLDDLQRIFEQFESHLPDKHKTELQREFQNAWNDLDTSIREGIWGAERAMWLGSRRFGDASADSSDLVGCVNDVATFLRERLDRDLISASDLSRLVERPYSVMVCGSTKKLWTAFIDLSLGLWMLSDKQAIGIDVAAKDRQSRPTVFLHSQKKIPPEFRKSETLSRLLRDPGRFQYMCPDKIVRGQAVFSFDVPFEIIESEGGQVIPIVDSNGQLGIEVHLEIAHKK